MYTFTYAYNSVNHISWLQFSAVNHLPFLMSWISISGCLGFPMTTMEASSGVARLTSALKNSEFSGRISSMISTVYPCRVLPGGKVISMASLGV